MPDESKVRPRCLALMRMSRSNCVPPVQPTMACRVSPTPRGSAHRRVVALVDRDEVDAAEDVADDASVRVLGALLVDDQSLVQAVEPARAMRGREALRALEPARLGRRHGQRADPRPVPAHAHLELLEQAIDRVVIVVPAHVRPATSGGAREDDVDVVAGRLAASVATADGV